MGVFLGLLLTVNNSLLDFEETLKLSLHSKKAFQGQFVCSENEGTDCDFLGRFCCCCFFSLSMAISIYPSLINSFHIFYYMFIDLFGCICVFVYFCVSSLACFLVCFFTQARVYQCLCIAWILVSSAYHFPQFGSADRGHSKANPWVAGRTCRQTSNWKVLDDV